MIGVIIIALMILATWLPTRFNPWRQLVKYEKLRRERLQRWSEFYDSKEEAYREER